MLDPNSTIRSAEKERASRLKRGRRAFVDMNLTNRGKRRETGEPCMVTSRASQPRQGHVNLDGGRGKHVERAAT